MTRHIRRSVALAICAVAMGPGVVAGQSAAPTRSQESKKASIEAQRISDASEAFSQIVSAEKKTIPRALLARAEAIAVFPGGLRVTGRRGRGPNTIQTQRRFGVRGRGIISVRGDGGSWSGPAFLTLNGGTHPQDSDLVLVVLNRRGLDNLTQYAFKLDGSARIADGPVGSKDHTPDIPQGTDILAYSRSRSGFTGVTLDGSTVQQDMDSNNRFYGQRLTSTRAVAQTTGPEPVAAWHAELQKHTR